MPWNPVARGPFGSRACSLGVKERHVDTQPPNRKPGGSNLLMLLILLVLIAGLAAWAWRRNPPDTPSPTATAAPATVPEGAAPPQG